MILKIVLGKILIMLGIKALQIKLIGGGIIVIRSISSKIFD